MSNSFNVASFTDEEFTRNLSNSSYNSSGISSSASYNANLSNYFVNDLKSSLLKDDNSRKANKLTPSGKHETSNL